MCEYEDDYLEFYSIDIKGKNFHHYYNYMLKRFVKEPDNRKKLEMEVKL